MKILFYLPANHPFWFNKVVAPMMRCAVRDAEVHVVVPPVWSDAGIADMQHATGITREQLESCRDLPDVRWHIVDGEDHPSLRTEPVAPAGLIDFVREIGADYTFCRSVDVRTPASFPGQVRYLMEGEFPPLPPYMVSAAGKSRWGAPVRSCQRVIMTGPGIYDHGIVPSLEQEERDRLLGQLAPMWKALRACRAEQFGDRPGYLAKAGLPADRTIIALPLDYDGPHSYFRAVHSVEPSNIAFVERLVAELDDDAILAVTLHPLLQQGNCATARHIETMDPDRIRLVRTPGSMSNATLSLIQHCDGMIVTDSKSFAEGAFFGKPMLRVSHFASGEWLNLYADLAGLQADLRAGTARAAAPEDVALWYAFHYANDAFASDDPGLTLEQLIDRVERPVDPRRWEANLGSYIEQKYSSLIGAFS